MSTRSPPDPVFTLRSGRQKERISALRFFPFQGEERLVSGTGEGNIDVWDLKTFRVASSWNTPDKEGILWLGYHEDKIISQSRKTICSWTPSNAQWTEYVKVPNSSVGFCCCDVSSDGILAIPTETDGKLQLLSAKSLTVMNEVCVTSKHGMCMCIKMAVPMILGGFEDGSIVVWDNRSKTVPLCIEKVSCPDPVTCMDFSSECKQGVSGSPGSSMYVWELSPEGMLFIKQNVSLTNSGLSCLKIRNDHRICVSGGWDSRIRVFSYKTFKRLAVLSHHSDNVTCLDFSKHCINECGQMLAAGSNDSTISLWNIYSKDYKQSRLADN